MEIKLTSAEIIAIKADGLIYRFTPRPEAYPAQTSTDRALGGIIEAMIKSKEIKAKLGELTAFYSLGKLGTIAKVVVVGLGKKGEFNADKLRQNGCRGAARSLQKERC